MTVKRPLMDIDLDVLLARLDTDLAQSEADSVQPRDGAAWDELRQRVDQKAKVVARKPFAKMTTPLTSLELEDVVQDVCIKLQRRKTLHQLQRANKPMGYLVTMIRHVAGDHLRRGLHRSRTLLERDESRVRGLGSSAHPVPNAIFAVIEQVLTTDEYALYQERYVVRRSIGQIAASRRITYSAANGRLRRMRERLRAIKGERQVRKHGTDKKTRKRTVSLDRLRAAYQANGLSWHQLAQKSGVSHPTLSRLISARGSRKSVRSGTLERLAVALRVPTEWLTGERSDLPYVPERYPWSPAGKEPSLWERPTAAYVQWSWLMQGVEKALRRDLNQWYGERSGDAYDAWGRGVLVAMSRLAVSAVWRSATLEPRPEQSWSELWQGDDGPSLVWLTHVLEPWFAGKAYLNAETLRGILAALQANPDVQILSSDSAAADAMRGLERYLAARREFAPDEMRFGSSEGGPG